MLSDGFAKYRESCSILEDGALQAPIYTIIRIALLSAALILLAPCIAYSEEISSYAFVQDDGTLRINGQVIRLFGIFIPVTEELCRFSTRLSDCTSRAARALEFKKGANFVHCEVIQPNQDGTISALCRVKGEDLGAYLVERGWALALPDAPFEYQALEKIARHRGVGLWAFSVRSPHTWSKP